MSRYAVIRDGVVENVVEWDGDSQWSPPSGASAIAVPSDSRVSVGWAYDGSDFVEPERPEPPTESEPNERELLEALAARLDISVADLEDDVRVGRGEDGVRP